MRRAVASPRPVPLPTSLVVKNESKMRSTNSGRDARAVVGDLDAHEAVGRVPCVIVIVPVSPSASIAFSSRFVHT